MKKKQLIALLICSFVVWTMGNGLMPLLPLYARQLGATESIAGYSLSFAFLSLALGTLAAGWLCDRFQRRRLVLIVAGLCSVPATFLMGRVDRVWQLVLTTGISWFCGGTVIATINILAGLFAAEDRRGQVFGLIGLMIGLGALGGGLSFGRLVDYRGYTFLFSCLGGFILLAPLAGLWLEDLVVQRQPRKEGIPVKKKLPSAIVFLMTAHFLAFTTNASVNLGRSLAMDRMGFTSSAIASTMAASGVVMIIAPLLLGWLSDRLGRKPFLLVCYAGFVLAALMTAWAALYWQFFVAMAFLALGAASMNVGAALVSDLVPPERLGRGMSLFQNMYWLGTMIGFAVSGNLLMHIGVRRTFLLWTAFPAAAVVLVFLIRVRRRAAIVDSKTVNA